MGAGGKRAAGVVLLVFVVSSGAASPKAAEKGALSQLLRGAVQLDGEFLSAAAAARAAAGASPRGDRGS